MSTQEPFCALSAARLARADRTNGARLIKGSAVNRYACYKESAGAVDKVNYVLYLQKVMGRCSLFRIDLQCEVQEILEDL